MTRQREPRKILPVDKNNGHTDQFLCGFATALGILQCGWKEHGLVVMMLRESGFTYEDLVNGGVEEYDLRLIREAFDSDHSLLTMNKNQPVCFVCKKSLRKDWRPTGERPVHKKCRPMPAVA